MEYKKVFYSSEEEMKKKYEQNVIINVRIHKKKCNNLLSCKQCHFVISCPNVFLLLKLYIWFDTQNFYNQIVFNVTNVKLEVHVYV